MTTRRRRLLLVLVVASIFIAIPIVGYALDPDRGLVISMVLTQVFLVVVLLRVWLSLDGADAQRVRELHRGLKDLERVVDRAGGGETVATQLQAVEQAALKLTKDVTRRLDAGQTAAADRMLEHERRLWELHGETARRLEESIEERFGAVERRFDQAERVGTEQHEHTVRSLTAVSDRHFRQLEALLALYHDLRPAIALPLTRSWVASPDLLHHLYRMVREDRPGLVLECGSGLSTVVMAYGVKASGHPGRVVALEHLEEYADRTRRMLEDHGLSDIAEVRFAPLQDLELDGETWPWYDRSQIPAGSIDLLLVDGPPGATRPQSRYPAVPILRSHLAPGAAVVLDDYGRPEEAEIADRWVRTFEGLELTALKHEKGTAVIRAV